MTNFIYDIYVTLPEIYLFLAICGLLVYGVLNGGSLHLGYPLLTRVIGLVSIQILILTSLLGLAIPYVNFFSWNFFLASSFSSVYLKRFLIFLSILWICFTLKYVKKEKINVFEYWILSLLTILAFSLLLQIFDLLGTYLIIELQSLSFYVLASFKRSSEFSTEAGLKYFVLGAFSSAFLLFGSSLIYGVTGATNFSDLNILFSGFLVENSIILFGIFLGLILLICALFFKLSAAPFHMWSPDVYEGSPTNTTAFFSLFPKIVIITLLVKIFVISFYDFINFGKNIFFSCSFFSLLFGTFGAFAQKKWKRFLAYSSINHIGFILIGFTSNDSFNIFSIFMYLFIYVITVVAIFSLILDLRIHNYHQDNQIRFIREILNLGSTNPLLTLSLTLILFSMAGIPPLSGFFAKVFIILAGVQNGVYSLIIFSIIMSSVACFYYIRIIQSIYFLKIDKWPIFTPITKINSFILGISCFLISFFFLDIELFSILLTRISITFL
uniref:NADH dehydrogenase subunit 2 n=1 Tax=Porolithon onkodes TaxID=231751 RepID=A0A2Z2KSE5_9FLOR|nr:NADH dehydrogenase subunit 2 [Porolithon onkodes]ASB29836.1 NADH dehydrogenase subunit 2 [Porolithon onkodes]